MPATLAAVDLLVAVAEPKVTAALQLADELYQAGCAAARAEEAYEEAQAEPYCSSQRMKSLNQARRRAGGRVADLSERFEQLMAGAEDDLYARVEEIVWRDRRAEYVHARAVAEREQGQRR